MKKIVLFWAGFCGSFLPVFGQLNALHNHFRAGDILFKQQVEYVDPGEAGANRLWNFSKLQTINDGYTLEYTLPPLEGDSVYLLGNKRCQKEKMKGNELIIGIEHNTMYYYHLKGDSLLQMGHENQSVVLDYTSPISLLRFPLNYGETGTSAYTSKGLYSGTVDIQTHGTVTTTADAYGKMILPSGDTLNSVLRVKTQQTIFDIPHTNSYTTETENNTGKQLVICRWYSKGYRYPVFETIRKMNLADNSIIFSTAFFFPPQDHLYLDTDPENMALLDQLWNLDKESINNPGIHQTETVDLKDILTCRMYPNPVSSILNLEYELKKEAKVSFQLFSVNGTPVKVINLQKKAKGVYHETLDCSSLYSTNYILRITADDLFANELIIKK